LNIKSTIALAAVAFSAALAWNAAARADVIITYQLSDVTFLNGATASGTFQFDTTTQLLENINVSSSAAPASGFYPPVLAGNYSSGHYTSCLYAGCTVGGFIFYGPVPNGNPDALQLAIDLSALPPSTTPLDFLPNYSLLDWVTNHTNQQATLSSGGVIVTDVAAAVPELSTWAMMIVGFCGLGYMTYRRKSAALRVA
jgi:hypothetical protein